MTFQPRISGNPAGRPKGSRNKATLMREQLLHGEAEAIMRAVIAHARAGHMPAMKLCLDRLLPPRKDRPIEFALPSLANAGDAVRALHAILAAVATGELTPSGWSAALSARRRLSSRHVLRGWRRRSESKPSTRQKRAPCRRLHRSGIRQSQTITVIVMRLYFQRCVARAGRHRFAAQARVRRRARRRITIANRLYFQQGTARVCRHLPGRRAPIERPPSCPAQAGHPAIARARRGHCILSLRGGCYRSGLRARSERRLLHEVIRVELVERQLRRDEAFLEIKLLQRCEPCRIGRPEHSLSLVGALRVVREHLLDQLVLAGE